MNGTDIMANALEIEPWMIALRRRLHQCPEPGFEEHETQRVIIEALEALGIPYQAERTWVVALIEGALPGKTVALRADMDALPVREPDGACAFMSKNPGYMHACGHDAHMAIQLGAARLLYAHRDALKGGVKLLFQPAEETVGGAEPMIQAGVMQNPHVDEMYALHVMPYLKTGQIETRPGALNASTDELLITVTGRTSHGAYPEQGADAILAAAHIVSALQSIVSRNVSPLQSAVVSIGQIEGGYISNILCSEVRMQGTLRATTPEMRALLRARATELAQCTARALGCEARVEIVEGYCALLNDTRCSAKVLSVAKRLVGEHALVLKPAPSMGGEDFGYFLREAPGAFYHLGCTKPDAAEFAPLHSDRFRIDEDCLKIGAAMQAALALEVLHDA